MADVVGSSAAAAAAGSSGTATDSSHRHEQSPRCPTYDDGKGLPKEYGGEAFPLVDVPLVMTVPAGVHPRQLINKMAKRFLLRDEFVLAKCGGFRNPGETTLCNPERGINCRWRLDASRDCVVIDFFRNGKLVPWRYDELRLVKPGASPDGEFHLGGCLLTGSTYLACVGTAGRFRWHYQLRVRDTVNPDLLHSSALTTWTDDSDLDAPYDPDVAGGRPHTPPSSSDDGPSPSGRASGGHASPLTTAPHDASGANQPRSPFQAPVDAPSAPNSPRQPISHEAPRSPTEGMSNGFCKRLLATCPLSVRRCCRRRQAVVGANRTRETQVDATPAAEVGGLNSKLRSWRPRMGAGAVRRGETSPQIDMVPPAPEARSMHRKLLNEDFPTAQKENTYCDP